jgi:nucleoside transporter
VCPVRVQRGNAQSGYAKLGALFFIQWMGLAAFMVPLTLVLNRHGYQRVQPLAFATFALAAFVSPLFFGAVADRHYAPSRVLRWLSVATAVSLTFASAGIARGWNPWLVLALIQLYSLCVAPTVSISTTIVMSVMNDPRRQFGPVRAVGTIGWMAGCWLVSLMNADSSPASGFSGAALWLGLAAFTYSLPEVKPPESVQRLNWHERLGLDALGLLKNRDHRVVFLSTSLLNIPLAAFYPYTPPHLRELGFERASAWLSLGQTTEIVAMFALGLLLGRWRFKWILFAGAGIALVRYILCALNGKMALLLGIALHGCTYTLIFTTAQIYVNERIDAGWRARAQALLTLMNGGVGYLFGYLGCGWWFSACTQGGATRWPLFWGVLAGAIALVLVYFLAAYRGIGSGLQPEKRGKAAP